MSKCQKNKYLAGGRSGAGSGASSGGSSGASGETSAAFSALLAAREAQTAALWKPAVAIPQQQPVSQQQFPFTQSQANTQMVLAEPPKNQINTKKFDINTILNGDY